ncbi:MAG: amino acid dehydrogenase [Ralstonia sp.]|nr:amino acid dehydrogenase [Ralstonia sp.]
MGAGIVGLATAAAQVRTGRSVTVIDANHAVGAGTSFGNGGQLSYGYVAPLAQPSLLPELPSLLVANGAPLRIVPKLDPAQWRWMLSFLQSCRAARAARSSLELLALGRLSQQETDLWLQGVDASALSLSRHGKLVVLPDAASFEKAKAQLQLQAPHGPEQFAIDETQCLRIEPALHAFRGRMAGAIHTPSECAVDSLALCQDLEARLRDCGVSFELGTRVHGVQFGRDRVAALETTAGRREVDGLVVAAGPQSASMARLMKFSVPVYPLKGYSVTLRFDDPQSVPAVSVTDAAKKVVYARLGQRLRVAGFAEIGGYDMSVDARRIQALLEHARTAFGSSLELEPGSEWVGLRPATPTSVPIVAQSPVRNVYLNVGHGALGLTLAFGTARRLADLMNAAPTGTQRS